MEAAIGVIIVIFILVIVLSVHHNFHYRIGNASVKFQTEGGTTVSAGRGSSLGEAVADGIRKLYQGLSQSSHKDTIENRLEAMERTLSENRNRMFQKDIADCEYYIEKTRALLSSKKEGEDRKVREKADSERQRREKKLAEEREKKRAQKEKETERKRKAAQKEKEREEKRAQAEAARLAREKNLPEQRRFVAEQRRLMTDALRYEVLKRDGFRCQICGATAADGYKLHIDHIIPVSKGGRTEMSNLRVLCERCNMGKRDKIEDISLKNEKSDISEDSAGNPKLNIALKLLCTNNAEYIDKTAKGGALYFFDKTIADELEQSGFTVFYTSKGTKGTNGRPAWYVKES